MIKGWRVAVVLIFVFAAVVTPTADPMTMFLLAAPLILLYFVAYGVARLIDRRAEGPARLARDLGRRGLRPVSAAPSASAWSSTRRPARTPVPGSAVRRPPARRRGPRGRRPVRAWTAPTPWSGAAPPSPTAPSTASSSPAVTAWSTSASTSSPAPTSRSASSPRARATTTPASSGCPVRDAAKAVERVIHGATRRIDAIRHATPPGRGPLVRRRARRRASTPSSTSAPTAGAGPRARCATTSPSCASSAVFRPIPYVIEVDGTRHETRAMLVAVGNGPAYGGGMRVVPDASFDDGLLDVLILHEVSHAELLRVFPKVFKGAHVEPPGGRDPPGPARPARGHRHRRVRRR